LVLGLLLSASISAAEIHHRYFYTSDGIRLHYLEAGTGEPAILFVPGWLMPAAIFESQLKALSDQHRVVVFDPRSQGQSDVYRGSHRAELRARDIHEWVTAVHAQGFVLAGWSLGVMEGLDYVHRYQPTDLRGLILIDNSIGEGTPPPATPSAPGPKLDHKTYLHRFVRSMFKTQPSPALLDTIDASNLQVSERVAAELLAKPYPREYYRQSLLSAHVPTLYAVTAHLKYQADALLQDDPNARVAIYPHAGHALFVDEAAQFNADVARFVATLSEHSPPLSAPQ
jgi:microsomal epoxide hydrolase